MFKAKIIAAFAVTLFAGSVFAGGPNTQTERVEPLTVTVEVPVVQEPQIQPTLPAIPSVIASPAHGLWVGSISTRDASVDDSETDLTDGFGDIGYLNYSPVGTGFSPVVGVNYGDVKGFNLGLGYSLGNWVKPYIGVASYDADDYFTSDAEIGAFVGTQFVLPMGVGVDLGVVTPDYEGIGDGGAVLPFIGLGFTW